MPLGWIDFSKSERNKVLSVLDRLSESGTLDELGIAPIRDGFANIFFPGTSTIQTRAKYFLLVPYALKDMEYSSENNPGRILNIFDEVEKECGKRLLENKEDTNGIIGSRSLIQDKWVKRTPADVYWAGLRSYGIFTGSLSLSEYVRAMCAMKKQKSNLTRLGSRNDSDEDEGDDKNAGDLFKMQFWNIPTYSSNWQDDINIKLTKEEGEFLKHQIVISYPDSMMAYILKNNKTEVLEVEDYLSLESLIRIFPENIQSDYYLARDFSSFLYVIRTLYNIIISDEKNEEANSEWEILKTKLIKLADVDLDRIINRLQIFKNADLCSFIKKEKEYMLARDIEAMKNEIKRRERSLKTTRAKTMHPGEFDPDVWFGGRELDYRFNNAKIIMRDIFESEGFYA